MSAPQKVAALMKENENLRKAAGALLQQAEAKNQFLSGRAKAWKELAKKLSTVGLFLLFVGCAGATKPDPMRQVKKLDRVTHCGKIFVEVEVPRMGTVDTAVEVCASNSDACKFMLNAFGKPVSNDPNATFTWTSCRPQHSDPLPRAGKRLLKR